MSNQKDKTHIIILLSEKEIAEIEFRTSKVIQSSFDLIQLGAILQQVLFRGDFIKK